MVFVWAMLIAGIKQNGQVNNTMATKHKLWNIGK